LRLHQKEVAVFEIKIISFYRNLKEWLINTIGSSAYFEVKGDKY